MDKCEAFHNGANAMHSHILAWLCMRGYGGLAIELMRFPLPDYSEPEQWTIASSDTKPAPSGNATPTPAPTDHA